MKDLLKAITLIMVVTASFFSFDILARQGAAADTSVSLTRPEIETIVRDYLLENPEILLEMQSALEAKMHEEQLAANRQVIADASDALFGGTYDGIIGNPDGDVTVVEFFDYNCGYCKRALTDMITLVENDENLRFVLKEFPILGPESQEAHVVSLAFQGLAPEKYGEFHRRLLGSDGRANEESAMALALDLGVDEAALRQEMQNPQIEAAINETYQLANQLNITGTPSYVIGEEVVFGARGQEHLSEKIENARQ